MRCLMFEQKDSKTTGILEKMYLGHSSALFQALKPVYSLRTVTPTIELIEFIKVSDNCQRDTLDQILVTVISDTLGSRHASQLVYQV